MISAMVPYSPSHRLLSLVTNSCSHPMIYIISRYSHVTPAQNQNCVNAELVDFGTMSSRLPRDVYCDSQGQPYELGYGNLMNLEFRSKPESRGQGAAMSSVAYELLLILCQLKAYLHCKVDLEQFFLATAELPKFYIPVDREMYQLSSGESHYAEVHESYEIIVRYLCGTVHYCCGSVKEAFVAIFEHFRKSMSGEGLNFSTHGRYSNYFQAFRMHRIVSFNFYTSGLY